MLIFWIHILALPILEEHIAKETESGVMVNMFQNYFDFKKKALCHRYRYTNIYYLCLFLVAVNTAQWSKHSRWTCHKANVGEAQLPGSFSLWYVYFYISVALKTTLKLTL